MFCPPPHLASLLHCTATCSLPSRLEGAWPASALCPQGSQSLLTCHVLTPGSVGFILVSTCVTYHLHLPGDRRVGATEAAGSKHRGGRWACLFASQMPTVGLPPYQKEDTGKASLSRCRLSVIPRSPRSGTEIQVK
jgi:hypothetical protein